MVITDETVEEQRLSDEADRADKQAPVQAEERISDDEETEDEEEQQLLKQVQAKRDARAVDRLARLKLQAGWRR